MIADFGKKQKGNFPGNKIAFQIAGILFLIIIIALIIADFKMYQRRKELALQIDNYKKQIAEIQKNSQTLKDDIANSGNQDYIEKIAYEQLGEQKPGEKEVIFVAPSKKPAPVSQSENFWSIKYFTDWLSQAWSWIKSRF